MRTDESSIEIDVAATEWVARTDRGPLSAEEQRGLDLWLAGDPRRQGAYVRALAAMRLLDRMDELPREAEAAPAPLPRARTPVSRRRLLTWGAPSMAAALTGVAVGVQQLGQTRYATRVGEIRQAPLADGSDVTLDTRSAAYVKFASDGRTVRLSHGQALFDVAKDPARPFVVEAGDVRARAVGTAFLVRHLDAAADVTVVEGVVDVWHVRTPERRLRLRAGQQTRVAMEPDRQAVASTLSVAKLNQQLAWRTGQIILDGETLSSAAEEFNRYSQRRLVIDDPDLGAKTLVGGFRADDLPGFARVAADALGAHVRDEADTIVLYR